MHGRSWSGGQVGLQERQERGQRRVGVLCPLEGVDGHGTTFFNQYMVVRYLARGNFGKVYLCFNTEDHRLYAVKVGR